MAKITGVELTMVDLPPKTHRVDAIQSFVSQETLLVTIYDSDGASGTGYAYTIGTGGTSVMALLKHTLIPMLMSKDPDWIDGIWHDLKMLEDNGICWFEGPLPADDVAAHAQLACSTSTPIAVGESLYSISQFKEYLTAGVASIVQGDVARIGGITPWLKLAYLAEAHNITVCPHFLMELHLSLVCAIPNAKWLEYIPQLDTITTQKMRVEEGHASPSDAPGIGIDWDWDVIDKMAVLSEKVAEGS